MNNTIESNGHAADAETRVLDALGNEFTGPSLADLAKSGIPYEGALRYGVKAVRHPDHVPAEILRRWVRGPGMLFEWRDADRTVIQFRPDDPVKDDDGDLHKYIFPGGCGTFLNHLREPDEGCPVLFVEGTKQGISAAVWAPGGWGVVAVPGCQNWAGTDLSWAEDRDVVCLFDADVTTNRDVHDAASGLKEALEAEGAASVRFARLAGARSKEGLDDVLGRREESKRTPYLQRIADAAKAGLGRPPARKKGGPGADLFNEKGSLLAQTATDAVLGDQPAALGLGSMVALYRSGRYVIDRGKEQLFAVVQDKLGEEYRPTWRATIEEVMVGRLAAEGRRLPERMPEPLLNCSNGMLDLRTGRLLPHSPDYLSSRQIPVAWDPDAACPQYLDWLRRSAEDQVDDLEESASLMLDPSRTPGKAVFLFGPSHSGKSTFLRVMDRIAGPENRSAVTLHQLSDDKFAAANLYARMLNVAADLSSKHVSDLSVFKMMSGEDAIHANRKYGREFTFTNQALFAFSANELPTVSEASRAYANRIKPFEFPHSFAGREDPGIEERIMRELPGVLTRWVGAWQRFQERGGYRPTDPRVMREFETRSDRVALWVSEKCDVHPDAVGRLVGPDRGTKKSTLHELFKQWAKDEDTSGSMSARKFLERLQSVSGVGEVRLRQESKNVGLNVTPRRDGVGNAAIPHQRAETDESPFEEGRGAKPTSAGPSKGVESVGSVGNETSLPYVCETKEMIMVQGSSDTHTYGQEGPLPTLATLPTPGGVSASQSPSVVGFDLETRGLGWARADRSPERPFVALYGVGDLVDTSPEPLKARLRAGDVLVGANVLGFDVLAVERHTGIRAEEFRDQVRDVQLQALIADPPTSTETKENSHHKSYSLDALGQRLLGREKDGRGKELVREYCTTPRCTHGRSKTNPCNGWENIPVTDPRYAAYCRDDMDLALRVHEAMPWTPYMEREMRVQLILARMTLNGFRVDGDLLARRIREGEERKAKAVGRLRGEFGLPSDSKSPLATKAGKEWLQGVYERFGVTNPPRTPKGSLATSVSVLKGLAEHPKCPAELREIITLMGKVTSERTIYQTITDHTVGGRVHPDIWPRQASGRWSVTKPGLTVVGKDGKLANERAVFLPEDDGEVIITVDMGQVDARMVAAHAQDPAYIELFAPGRDVHKETAIAMMGDAKYRSECKPISHLANYGGGQKKLISMGHDPELVRRFFAVREEKFPGLITWQGRVREQGASGELLDNGFGRPLRVERDFAYTQAPAQIGQGGTRDMMAEGLLTLAERAPECLPMLRAIVHDEVVLSVPQKDAQEIGRTVVSCFEREWAPPGASVPVYFTADFSGPGVNWADAYRGK